jgi:2-polyprenyl-3-methyl-5-hydroxy-6-metoxy-1,4-benzoquinol methylase
MNNNNYKYQIYSKYVKAYTHVKYGDLTLRHFEKNFSVWDKYYLKIFDDVNLNASFLDLGCGNGVFLHYLKARGFKNLKGIDVSEDYINEGIKLGIENISKIDIYEELHNDNKYDIIIARDVMEHFEKDEVFEIFELIFNKLQPGGKFILQVPNGDGINVGLIYYSDFTHSTLLTESSLNQMALTIGFKEVSVLPTGPVATGLTSLIRILIWGVIIRIVNFIRLVETGKKSNVLTQNLIGIVTK